MKITNFHNLPAPLFYTVKRAVELYEGPRALEALRSRRISVTTLINPPRLTMLRAMHEDDIEVDASSLLYLVQGIAFHFMMAELSFDNDDTQLVEHRAERGVDGWIVSGQFDSFGKHVLSDWKWTSVWSIVMPKFEWDAQLNLYRWLSPDLEVHVLETWAMLRDWSVAKMKKDRRLPTIPFARVERPIWTEAVVEAYVKDRIALYERAAGIVQGTLDPNRVEVCTPEERWERKGVPVRCRDYCDVAQWCAFGCTQLTPAEREDAGA